jgi:outer membrane usher protein
MTISFCPRAEKAARYQCASRLPKPFIAWLIAVGMQPALAQDVFFNSAFLPEGSEHLDLTPFQTSNVILPGDYRADVFVNGRPVGRNTIRLSPMANGDVAACFTPAMLEAFGVDPRALVSTEDQDHECLRLPDKVQGSRAEFNMQSLELRVSIPQVSMRHEARGYVNPELWSAGATAAKLGYNFNATRTLKGDAADTAYLGFDAGLNLGNWRVRNNGSVNWKPTTGANYQNLNTYVQRDFTALRSQLTLGETYTTGELFNTLVYRGVQLATDDRMLPQSLRGYAPTISGIARTSARVVVRQNGNVLLETLVAPGAFMLDDLYSSGYGGDLEVTVHEADGSIQRFIVPYASVSQLLRPGVSRFSLTAGELRNPYLDRPPTFVQGTFQHGLSNFFTGEGGFQASDKYNALLAGMAMNTPLGALAVDLTHTKARFLGGPEQGESLRLLYSKSVSSTGSYFNASSYWYSASGAHELNDATQRHDAEQRGLFTRSVQRESQRLNISANQRIGEWGQLGISAFSRRYWNAPGPDLQYQLIYSTQVGRVGLSLNANRSRMALGAMDTSYLLTLNLPLEFGATRSLAQLSTRLGRDAQGKFNEDVYLSASAGEFNQYSYGIGAQRDGGRGTTGTSWNGQYQGSKATAGGALSQGDDYAALSISLGGSMVGHSNGLTLSPFRSETIAVVSAPGAQGAQISGYPGVTLDGQGNAIVPYLRPYEFNEVGIDPRGSSMDVELSESSRKVAPTAGAILAVDFATSRGRALLLNVQLEDASPLPFGSSVSLPGGQSLGLVGQGGQLYARIPDGSEQLNVSWGREANQKCVLTVPTQKTEGPLLQPLTGICRFIPH